MFDFFKKRSLSAAAQSLSFEELISGNHSSKLSAVFGAVSVISSTISSLSLQMFYEKRGLKKLAKAHPLYRLLKHKPNRYMSANALIEALVNNMLIYGVGYLHPRKNALGEVLELELLSSENIAKLSHDTLKHKSLVSEFAFLQGIYKMKFKTEYKKSIYLVDDVVGRIASAKIRAKKYRYYL